MRAAASAAAGTTAPALHLMRPHQPAPPSSQEAGRPTSGRRRPDCRERKMASSSAPLEGGKTTRQSRCRQAPGCWSSAWQSCVPASKRCARRRGSSVGAATQALTHSPWRAAWPPLFRARPAHAVGWRVGGPRGFRGSALVGGAGTAGGSMPAAGPVHRRVALGPSPAAPPDGTSCRASPAGAYRGGTAPCVKCHMVAERRMAEAAAAGASAVSGGASGGAGAGRWIHPGAPVPPGWSTGGGSRSRGPRCWQGPPQQ